MEKHHNISDTELDPDLKERLKFNDQGLILAVIQDFINKDVLMVAWMDDVALAKTLTTGRVWFWSRSRQEYWRKGDTSGHIQIVHRVQVDCDGDSLLVFVEQRGSACHTGERTCFISGGDLPIVIPPKIDGV
ncbi:phosphoribosyl-AMP cyclohydrolase [Arcanobacterium ihumii]|uniref:phosphoribosyl-AMP cyclohydrolase n=1 Tax=Arcanobacterium ihumii TaxID=2138162 RepID=UPI000F535C8F|nr:phosphoribosyl-AMP cyclohydrolase [Arcanobacterium ihumii]